MKTITGSQATKLAVVLPLISMFSWSAIACDPAGLKLPITDKSKTFIRKGFGEWQAPRAKDKPHGGVDLIVRETSKDPLTYVVASVAAGTVVTCSP